MAALYRYVKAFRQMSHLSSKNSYSLFCFVVELGRIIDYARVFSWFYFTVLLWNLVVLLITLGYLVGFVLWSCCGTGSSFD